MDKNKFWRLFRSLVCMVLICCILVNISPIRAKAVALETAIGIGIIAALIAAACGVAFHPQTSEDFAAIGNSFSNHLMRWSTDNGTVTVSETYLGELWQYAYLTSGGFENDGSDPGNPRDYRHTLARGLLAGISTWCASIILGTSDIKTQIPGQDGFAYFNGLYMPIPISSVWENHQYKFLVRDVGQYIFYSSDYPCTANPTTFQGGDYFTFGIGTSCWVYKLQENGSYEASSSTLNSSAYATYRDEELIWANHDVVYRYQTDKIYLPASEPMTTEEYILSPYFLGDIPQKVQDGEIEEDEIPLPLEIDFEKLFERTGTTTAQEAVQKTLEQLSTGQMTYDQYMDSIKVDSSVDSGDSGSAEETQPVVDPDVWTPPSDPGAFALDLSEIFPFCIPFDLYDFLTCLNADPVAPVIQWEVPLPGGGAYPLELDLSPFDPVAQLLRRLQLLLFCVALAMKTRDLIKG